MKSILLLVFGLCSIYYASLASAENVFVSSDDRPNILWIYVDDMSDWMSCYGDKNISTPNIDELAVQGIRFEKAYVTSPVCSTTRSAIITGQYQTSLGLHHHRTMIKKELSDRILTVPEVFRKAGYVTFNESKDDYNFLRDRKKLYSPEFKRPKVRGHFDGGDLSWLKQLKGKSFFGQIQLKGGKIGGETGAKFPADSRVDVDQLQVPPQYPDDKVFRNAIARHYEQVIQTDAIVGQIVRALKDYELWDNTIVFFFTDHGSPLPRSKQFLYSEGIKVPLIVRLPEKYKKTGSAKVRTDLVSSIDISATSIGLAGLEIPSTFEGKNVFSKGYQRRTFVVAARDRCGIAVDRIRSVTTDNFHYIRNYYTNRALYQSNYRDKFATFTRLRELHADGGLSTVQKSYLASKRAEEELYSLSNDPHQLKNLAENPKFNFELETHRKMLDGWVKATGDQGRVPESKASLKRVFLGAKGKVTAPEFDFLKKR